MVEKPSGIVAVTAHIREDRFYCIDDQGRTWVTEHDGSMTMIPRESIPEGTPQWRGLWRDGDIPGLLYFAAGEGGIWKSVDGFATEGGFFPLRQAGVDGAPGNIIHRRVGLHGQLGDAPIPPAQGDVYLVVNNTVRVRSAANTWETLVRNSDLPSGNSNSNLMRLASPRGYPERLWLLGNRLWTSENNGQTWNLVELPQGMSYGSIEWIECKPGVRDSIYLAIRQNNDAIAGTWRSTDAGQTWERILGHYYTVGSQGPNHINFSHDGSRLWVAQRINMFPGLVSSGQTIWYTDTEGEPLNPTGYSAHGSQDVWGTNDPNLAYIVRREHVSGDAPIRVRIVGGEPERTHVTNGISDGNSDTRTFHIAVNSNGTVMAVYGNGARNNQQKVFRTTNEENSWQEVLSHINFGGLALQLPMAAHPNNPSEFWVAGGDSLGGYVFYTQDGGDTWHQEHVSNDTHRHMFVAG